MCSQVLFTLSSVFFFHQDINTLPVPRIFILVHIFKTICGPTVKNGGKIMEHIHEIKRMENIVGK